MAWGRLSDSAADSRPGGHEINIAYQDCRTIAHSLMDHRFYRFTEMLGPPQVHGLGGLRGFGTSIGIFI